MKVFVLVSRVPWPLEKGDKLRAWHQVRELSKRHEVFLCCLTDEPVHRDAVKHLETIAKHVAVVKLSRVKIIVRLAWALFSSRPFQVHYFFQRAAARMVTKHLTDFAPNHIYCQLVRCSEYVKHVHHIPKTLDYMDAFNKGMERLAAQSTRFMKRIRQIEAERLVRYENLIFDYFDHHTIISEQDRALIYHPQRKRIVVVRNGVDTDFFTHHAATATRKVVVFTGNMSYPPNIDSAELLAREVMPLVRKRHPDALLLLAGADPHQRVRDLAEANHVEVTGWLDDIRQAYQRGMVFAAPLRIGTGLQNKLLEAMSMQLPCITTTLANNALKAPVGDVILVADHPAGQAEAIVQLIDHESDRRRLSSAGRAFVEANYSWEGACAKLINLIG